MSCTRDGDGPEQIYSEHQYTIPVEWGYQPESTNFIQRKMVTRLMCPCGAEKERK